MLNLLSHISRGHLHLLLCLLIAQYLSPSNVTADDGLTIDEQLKQLQQNDALKTAQLKALAQKVQRLETILTSFMDERTNAINENDKFLLQNADSTSLSNKASGKSSTLRTCREARAADPQLGSGMYWIDPDGQGVGDDPIYVYCDMTTGTTSVLHDSEMATDVGHCELPGCYSKIINYSASMKQMKALAELSDTCHQSIMYNCTSAPFEISGVSYAWWNDKDGNPQYFWSGNNASVHTCQCGLDHNCLESFMNCNCDSVLPVPVIDSGIITDKNYLPITRVNFGRTIVGVSTGIYTLGRLECKGQAIVEGVPKSCSDLWKIGHVLSGLYSIGGENNVQMVYCDFAKLPNESGFQNWIGFADVMSLPVYFHVARSAGLGGFNTLNTPVTFDTEILNTGRAMNMTSGIFTAPRKGTYSFSFSSVAYFGETSGNLSLQLYINGRAINYGHAHGSTHDQATIHSTLCLNVGDRLWTEMIAVTNPNCSLTATYFTGWLLQQELTF